MLPRDYIALFPDYHSPSDNSFLISKNASDKRRILNKLSELEKRLNAISTEVSKKVDAAYASTEKIAGAALDDLRDSDPNKFFKLAAEKGIILSPENFFGYVFGTRIKEASIQEVKSLLRDAFSSLEKDAEVVNNERYDGDKPVFNDVNEKRLVQKIASSHSLFKPFIDCRLAQNLEKVGEARIIAKSMDPYAMELAKQYIGYKVAALNKLASLGKLTDDILLASVLQNRL